MTEQRLPTEEPAHAKHCKQQNLLGTYALAKLTYHLVCGHSAILTDGATASSQETMSEHQICLWRAGFPARNVKTAVCVPTG